MTIPSIREAVEVLPRSIAFLAARGISPAVLLEAGRIATRVGVAPDVSLIRGGLIDEESAYRALAREMGLPFTLTPIVDRAARYPESILTGIAPLERQGRGACFAWAPLPERFGEAATREAVSGLVVTTPTALRTAVSDACGPRIANPAAETLDADRSARSGLSAAQSIVLAGLAASLIATSFVWPAETGAVAGLLLFVFFIVNVVIRIAATITRAPVNPAHHTRQADAALPTYTVLLPVYREARVLGRLIAAVERFDYPKAKLDAKLLVEAEDVDTLRELARIGRPHWLEVVVVPPGEPRTKPRALNVALPLARGEFLTIYDAEDVPDPGQLRLAVEFFRRSPPDLACFQARLLIDNTADNLLARLFTLEYAALFDVVNPALAMFDLPIPLGGTSNHIRTATLRALGGWDAWNVTEDADLGLRLASAGYKVGDLPSQTLEEAPPTLHAWIRQRRRWLKGFLQVAITHSRQPKHAWRILGPIRFVGASAMTTGIVASALAYPFFLAFIAGEIATGEWIDARTPIEALSRSSALTLFAAGWIAMIIPALEGARRRRLWTTMPFALLMPLYCLLVSWAAWRAVADLIVDPFCWLKTEHGWARTSRSGLFARRFVRGAGAGPVRLRPAASPC